MVSDQWEWDFSPSGQQSWDGIGDELMSTCVYMHSLVNMRGGNLVLVYDWGTVRTRGFAWIQMLAENKKTSRKSVSTNNIQGIVDHTRQERIQNLKIFLLQGHYDNNHRRLGFFFFYLHLSSFVFFFFFLFKTVSTVIAKVTPSRKSLAHSVRTNKITWFITF